LLEALECIATDNQRRSWVQTLLKREAGRSMRRPKPLTVSRDKSQDLGRNGRKQSNEQGSHAAGRQKSRDSHAIARDQSQGAAAEAPQPPKL
jgi:hypothetical protein